LPEHTIKKKDNYTNYSDKDVNLLPYSWNVDYSQMCDMFFFHLLAIDIKDHSALAG